jgi:hypothetical protein
MRWKLLVIVSFAAALAACGLWSALVVGAYGTARAFARNDWLLRLSTLIPLGMAVYSGIFFYRHTARRRRTQATFTVILALLLTAGIYLVATGLFHDRLYIPRTYDVRQAR